MGELIYGLIGITLLVLPPLLAKKRSHARSDMIFLITIAAVIVAAFSPLIGILIWIAVLIWATAK